jgi:hypothetical protein
MKKFHLSQSGLGLFGFALCVFWTQFATAACVKNNLNSDLDAARQISTDPNQIPLFVLGNPYREIAETYLKRSDIVEIPNWETQIIRSLRTSWRSGFTPFLVRFCFASEVANARAFSDQTQIYISSVANGKEEQNASEVGYGVVFLKRLPRAYLFEAVYLPLH